MVEGRYVAIVSWREDGRERAEILRATTVDRLRGETLARRSRYGHCELFDVDAFEVVGGPGGWVRRPLSAPSAAGGVDVPAALGAMREALRRR